MAQEIPPSQIVSADVARAAGIPTHPEADRVALYGFTIEDKRPDRSQIKDYHPFTALLDRILVRRIEPEKLVNGYLIPDKYREMENWGEVVSVGQGVVLGREWRPLTDFVNIGDLVKYGEHTAERFSYKEDDPLFIVRIQDCRGVRRLKGE